MMPYRWTNAGVRVQNMVQLGLTGTLFLACSASVYCHLENGGVLLLHDAAYGTVPFGVGFPNIKSMLDKHRFRPGMQVICHEDKVSIPEAEFFTASGFIQPDSSCVLDRIDPTVLSMGIETAKRQGWLHGSKNGLGELLWYLDDIFLPYEISLPTSLNLFSRYAFPAIRNLSIALLEDMRVENPAGKLLGLGPGLTPSGDDLLTGLLAAMHFAGDRGWPLPKGYEALRSWILQAGKLLESPVSMAYLQAAANGDAFTLLDNSFKALFYGDGTDAIDRLLAVGSSSGTDMLLGMLVAGKILLESINN